MHANPKQSLKDLGQLADNDIPLLETAFLLAELQHEGISLDRYRQHVITMAEQVGTRFKNLIEAGADDDALTRLAALKHIIHDQHGYMGDNDTYDDIQNADIIRVIDRRKGLPISLAILTLAVGRANGWQMDGINFPGHFLVRITHNNQIILCDPFTQFRVMLAHDLRELIKKIMGADAELSSTFYDVAPARLILLRLQNNIKARQIDVEDFEEALNTVLSMKLFAPNDYRILFDEAVLRAKLGEAKAAIGLLEIYITRAERQADIHDANLLLQSLREALN